MLRNEIFGKFVLRHGETLTQSPFLCYDFQVLNLEKRSDEKSTFLKALQRIPVG